MDERYQAKANETRLDFGRIVGTVSTHKPFQTNTKRSLTKRWSEAGCLSQIMLSHALRQATGSLILSVRHTGEFRTHGNVAKDGTCRRDDDSEFSSA